MKQKLYCIVVLSLVICFSCSSVKQNIKPSQEDIEKTLVDTYYTKQSSLFCNDYEVIKLKKKEKIEDNNVDVSYAVIKHNQNVLFQFDGLYHPLGNSTDFGLVSLLDDRKEQLIVSQTIPRQGRHWIVDLSNKAQIIFDSFDYNLGREEYYLTDIDGDGVKEIILELTAFWGFNGMSMAESPLIEIIFKYDKNTNKYVPANHFFQNHSSKILKDELKTFNSTDEKGTFSNIFKVFLLFLYSGQQQQAWDFFDKNYINSDKQDVILKIKNVLEREPIYKYIYRQ